MKLTRFIANGVHGYLDFDLEFKEKVTFLVGINGTGKTTVLKLILGLISPSYKYLSQIEFLSVSLHCCDDNGKTIRIQAFRVNSEQIDLALHHNSGSLSGTLILTKFSEVDNEEDYKRHQLNIHNFEEQEIVIAIKKLTTPIYLGLDRRIYEGGQIDRLKSSIYVRKKYREHLGDSLNQSLIDLQEVVNDFYRKSAGKQKSLSEEFKERLLQQYFNYYEYSSDSMQPLLEEFDIEEKRKETLKAVADLKFGEYEKQINQFFSKIDKIYGDITDPKSTGETVREFFANVPQLSRINNLINLNQELQRQSDILFEPIERFRRLVERFLSESSKSISIQLDGTIKIVVNRKDYSSQLDIFKLSSGEKQILTMIGHLIFYEDIFKKEPGVFIIDEPELSLHLAWQEIFIDCIREASPKTQFIIATHSPSIVAKFEETDCVDLGNNII